MGPATATAAAPPAVAPIPSVSTATARNPTMVGLRAIAALFVVGAHLRLAVPIEDLERLGPLYGLFTSTGGTWFLTLGAFLVTVNATSSDRPMLLTPFWISRLIRLLVPVVTVLAAVIVVDELVDNTPLDPAPAEPLRAAVLSAVTLVTFTFNWLLIGEPGATYGALGHLWFLSVQQQFLLIAVPLILAARRYLVAYREVLGALFGMLAIASFLWRQRIVEVDGWETAAMSTSTRADALLLGAGAGLVLPYLAGRRTLVRWLRRGSLVVIGTFVGRAAYLDEFAFLHLNGLLAQLGVVVFIATLYVDDSRSATATLIGGAPLRRLGAASFSLYLWHYPVMFGVPRLLEWRSWQATLAVTVACWIVLVPLSYLMIERPTRRLARAARRLAAAGREGEVTRSDHRRNDRRGDLVE